MEEGVWSGDEMVIYSYIVRLSVGHLWESAQYYNSCAHYIIMNRTLKVVQGVGNLPLTKEHQNYM